MITRRHLLVAAAGTMLAAPARATPAEVAAAIRAAIGDRVPVEGRIKLDVPVLVENGNAVSMVVGIEALASEVRAIHVFADGNPLPRVITMRFGPRAGRPQLATRFRLATSQTVIAIADMADGSCFSDRVELLVTLAACIE